MSHIFTDDGKQWGLVPKLPVKPAMKNPGVSVQRLYDKALAEAKANALPIVNPEVAVWPATRDYYFHEYLKIEINRVELGKLYEWPGTWEFDIIQGIDDNGVVYFTHRAKLIAPQQNAAHGYTEGADAPQQPQAQYKCADCGNRINEGEFKTFGVCDTCWDAHHKKETGREEKIATQIAGKIAAIPENKPEHAADHKLRAIEEIIDNTIKMVERHTGKELRDQLSKEREEKERLHNELEKETESFYNERRNFRQYNDKLKGELEKEREFNEKLKQGLENGSERWKKHLELENNTLKEQLEKEREMRKEFQVIAEEIVNESGFPGCNYTCSSHWRTEFKSILAKASELDKT